MSAAVEPVPSGTRCYQRRRPEHTLWYRTVQAHLRLRYFLPDDAVLQGVLVRILLRAVERCLREHSPGSSAAARLGAVVFIHRCGSALNAHLHFHSMT